MNLSDLKISCHAAILRVTDIILENKLKERGIFNGTVLVITAKAPGGCPFIVESGNVSFGIRRADAEKIIISCVE